MASENWIVEDILPDGELHIIGGPSGGSKTTFLFQFITDWRSGKPIFGHTSHSRPFIYISLDRGEKSVRRTLQRCGIDPDTFPHLSLIRTENPVESFKHLQKEIMKVSPEVITNNGVIFVEGLTTLAPSTAKASDYASMARWIAYLSALCNETGITIFGIMHSPKTKQSERYMNPRQRVLGSVAIGGFTETMILVEPDENYPTGNRRTVTLLPRNAPEEVFFMVLDSKGMLVEAPPDQEENEHLRGQKLLDRWLKKLPAGFEFSTGELMVVADELDVGDTTVKRWMHVKLSKLELERISHGKYRKSLEQ